jgi:hypothetical protein
MIDGTNSRAARILGLDDLCHTVKFNANGRSVDLRSQLASDWPVAPDVVDIFEPWISIGFMRPPAAQREWSGPRRFPESACSSSLRERHRAGDIAVPANHHARPAALVDRAQIAVRIDPASEV